MPPKLTLPVSRLLLGSIIGWLACVTAWSDIGPRQAGSVVGIDSVSGSGGSFAPGFSADGLHIAFISHANNLVTNDDNNLVLDVFVRDLAAGVTRLVSVQPGGRGGGNGNSIEWSISSNGQFIVFQTEASNLVENDANNTSDILLRNVTGGTTTLVSLNSAGTASGNGPSSNPHLSADGRFIVFESLASDLVANDTNGLSDVFVRDQLLGTTTLVSVNSDGTGSGNGSSDSACITPDGRWVAFVSTSTDLVPGAVNPLGEVYVRDLQTGATSWASGGAGGFVSGNIRSYHPVLSADGKFVVFMTRVVTNAFATILRHDLQTSLTGLVGANTPERSWPEVNAEGRFVAYEALAEVMTNQAIYRWDAQGGTNLLVSVNLNGPSAITGTARNPVMSADGNRIAFLSTSDSLTTNAGLGRFQVFGRDMTAGTTKLVSVNLRGAAGEDLDGVIPAISADGTKVTFDSVDGALVADDRNQASDAFICSLDFGTMELISRRAESLPSVTGQGTGFLTATSLSSNGQFVVFQSYDGTVARGDTNGATDVFVRDFRRGINVFVSAGTNGPASTNISVAPPLRDAVISGNGQWIGFARAINPLFGGEDSGANILLRNRTNGALLFLGANLTRFPTPPMNPSLSADGRLVAFHTTDPLVAGDTGDIRDVYVFDTVAGTNRLVSLSANGISSGFSDSQVPVISPDGHWVVFQSRAVNLIAPPAPSNPNFLMYARDLISNRTHSASLATMGFAVAGKCSDAVISADSRFVAFTESLFTGIFVHDLILSTNRIICTNCAAPGLSGDGRLVVFETIPNAQAKLRQVFLYDRFTDQTNLVSINRFGGPGNGHSKTPVISADGRFVVFASRASDLVANDTNQLTDIFVRDLVQTNTMLVSLNMLGTGPGNRASFTPRMAADGRTVVFHSFASDLVASDFNDNRDFFLLRFSAGDSDGDGLDDDWEMAYFGNLSREGSGDFDGDGLSDRAEFLAGTDPTNSGSILRVLTLTAPGSPSTTVIWSAVPGRKYQAQFKNKAEDAQWTDLGGTVNAIGSTASQVDATAGGANHRFYRVILSP